MFSVSEYERQKQQRNYEIIDKKILAHDVLWYNYKDCHETDFSYPDNRDLCYHLILVNSSKLKSIFFMLKEFFSFFIIKL